MNDSRHQSGDEITLNLSDQETFKQAALIRLFTFCKEYGVNFTDFIRYLSLIGCPQAQHNPKLLFKELNKTTSKIKLILNNGNEEIDINSYNLNLSFKSDLTILKIYKILSNSESISDPLELIKTINDLEFLFISLNCNLMSYFVMKAQTENTFLYDNNYSPSFAYHGTIKTIKTIASYYLGIEESSFSKLFLKDSIEQLKCIADFLFLIKSIVDISNFPLISDIEKSAFNKILEFFLIHLQDASIHKIIVQQNPVSRSVEPSLRKATDNTTRIILFYQMKKQYSYKLRIDLPHVDVDLPHINFYFLNKEMVGPIPKEIGEKYEVSSITYKDVCDGKYYFNPNEKGIDDEIKSQIKKYRHKNLLITDVENKKGLDRIFENLINHLYANNFFSIKTSCYTDDTGDQEIFDRMKKRGLASLLSLLTVQNVDTSPLIKQLITDFPENELEELSKEDLLEFLHAEIYGS